MAERNSHAFKNSRQYKRSQKLMGFRLPVLLCLLMPACSISPFSCKAAKISNWRSSSLCHSLFLFIFVSFYPSELIHHHNSSTSSSITTHFPCNHNITAPVISIFTNANGINFFQPKFIN
jgi:hypothetical protein